MPKIRKKTPMYPPTPNVTQKRRDKVAFLNLQRRHLNRLQKAINMIMSKQGSSTAEEYNVESTANDNNNKLVHSEQNIPEANTAASHISLQMDIDMVNNPEPEKQNIHQLNTEANYSDSMVETSAQTTKSESYSDNSNHSRTDLISAEPGDSTKYTEDNPSTNTPIASRLDREQNDPDTATNSVDKVYEAQNISINTNSTSAAPSPLLDTPISSTFVADNRGPSQIPDNQLSHTGDKPPTNPTLTHIPEVAPRPTKFAPKIWKPVLLWLLGLKPDAVFEEHKRYLNEQHKNLPPISLCVEDQSFVQTCTGIYTSNWPTWVSHQMLREIFEILTDFNFSTGIYSLDVLLYKTSERMGAALLRFATNSACMFVYNQMRVITALQTTITVELDLNEKVGNLIDKSRGPKKYRLKKKWLGPEISQKDRGDNVFTFITCPENYQPDVRPGRELKTVTLPLTLSKVIKIQDWLGLKQNTYVLNKLEVKEKLKNKSMPAISDYLLQMAKQCTRIFVTNFPAWFQIPHYKLVLNLLTDFDWDDGIYVCDILKYSNHTCMGAVLIKFVDSATCFKVFQHLRVASLLQEHINKNCRLKVQLDIYGNGEKFRRITSPLVKWMDPKLDWKLRMRYILTSLHEKDPYPNMYTNNNKQPDDMDDMAILVPQAVIQIDLTEDDEENMEWTNKTKSKNNDNDSLLDLNEASNDSDKTTVLEKIENSGLDYDLSELIEQELMDIDIKKMIKEDDDQNTDKNTVEDADTAKNGVRKSEDGDPNDSITENAHEKQSDKQTKVAHLRGPTTETGHDKERDKLKRNDTQLKVTNYNGHTTETPYEKHSDDVIMLTKPNNGNSEMLNYTISDEDAANADGDNDDDNDGATESNCKIVYVKNLPPLNTNTKIKMLIMQHTKYDIKKQFLFKQNCRMKCLGECMLKFDSHEDAVEVATGINEILVDWKITEATLDIGHKVWKSNNFDDVTPSTHLKRKLISDGTQMETSTSQPKRYKFGNCWKRAYMKPEEPDTNNYGFSKEFFYKIGCKLPLSSFVIVRNLHEKVNEAKLLEVFSLAGNVKQVALSFENNEYTARIEYDHPVEAVQAVSMLNNQKLYDRTMDVIIDNTFKQRPLPLGLSGIGKGLGRCGEPVKGVRTQMELRQVHEILYEMGRMNKFENKDEPFGARYTIRSNPTPCTDTSSGVKIIQPGIKPNTSQALEALGDWHMNLNPNVDPNMRMWRPHNMVSGPGVNPNVPVIRPNFPTNVNMCPSTLNPGMTSDPNRLPVRGIHNESHQAPVNPNIPSLLGAPFNPRPYIPPAWDNVNPNVYLPTTNQVSLKPTTKVIQERTAQMAAVNSDKVNLKATDLEKKAHVVRFQNLPPSVTLEALTKKMMEIGDIQYAEITGIGQAIVLFKKYTDAEICLQLFHRSKVDGHVIEVIQFI